MLMRCPSIGVGSCDIMFWIEAPWTSHGLNFFLKGGAQASKSRDSSSLPPEHLRLPSLALGQ